MELGNAINKTQMVSFKGLHQESLIEVPRVNCRRRGSEKRLFR